MYAVAQALGDRRRYRDPPGVWKETTRSCRCIVLERVANWSKEDLDAQRWEYNHIEQGNISLAGHVYDQLKTMLAFLALLDFRGAKMGTQERIDKLLH